jgi:hypothetical protein
MLDKNVLIRHQYKTLDIRNSIKCTAGPQWILADLLEKSEKRNEELKKTRRAATTRR